MVNLSVPGYGELNIEHVVMDYNGTLAVDGLLLPGVKAALLALSRHLTLHVLTADTFGKANGLLGVPCTLSILPASDQQAAKLGYVQSLGPEKTVSIGNGRNDQRMLKASRLGIAVVLGEGASMEAVTNADIVCTSIVTALELMTHPLRLTATLRS